MSEDKELQRHLEHERQVQEALKDELVGVVRKTMQPTHVSLWLRPDTASKKGEHSE